MINKHARAMSALLLPVAFWACGDDAPVTQNPEEVITTVRLAFTGPSTFTATAKDADGDGTVDTKDPITLAAGSYTVEVTLLNELESPAEDITEEVKEESDEHQLFFTVTGLPAASLAITYADTEMDYGKTTGLPVGLKSTWVNAGAGTGQVTVQLQHLPPVNEAAQKVAGVTKATGDTDVSVTFDVTTN
jgi:hypothetical protein